MRRDAALWPQNATVSLMQRLLHGWVTIFTPSPQHRPLVLALHWRTMVSRTTTATTAAATERQDAALPLTQHLSLIDSIFAQRNHHVPCCLPNSCHAASNAWTKPQRFCRSMATRPAMSYMLMAAHEQSAHAPACPFCVRLCILIRRVICFSLGQCVLNGGQLPFQQSCRSKTLPACSGHHWVTCPAQAPGMPCTQAHNLLDRNM